MIERLWRCDALRVHLISHIGVVVAAAVVLVAGQPATAQYTSDFEAKLYTGSPDGIIITGQDGFYIPVPDSQDGLVYTYAGNALGLPPNPSGGGDQFAGVTGGDPALPVPFARAQRDLAYGDGTGVWTVSFDIAATYIGVLPSAQNIGSFSTQVFPDQATFIALARWTDPATADSWNADYVWFDAQGTQLTESVDDPAFQGLDVDHWYRWSTTFNLDTNQILQVSITDLTTGATSTNSPMGRYLVGGTGGAATPTGFRLFGGSITAAGNTLAFDNISIDLRPGPLGACCLLDGSCVVLTEADCTAADGIYSGDGTGCTPNTCVDVPEACGKGAGPCNQPNRTPGCEDEPCCAAVCAINPLCCIDLWDQECVDIAINKVGCASPHIDVLGACCLAADCLLTTVEDCAAKGGDYQGEGIDCGAGDPLNFESAPNIPIPDADPEGVSDTINVPDSIIIGDVNVDLTITHTWVGDLCVSLEHNNVVVNLIQRPGADTGEPCHLEGPFGCLLNNYVGIVLDDVGAGGTIEDACETDLTSPPNYVPNEALSAFNGIDSSGDWTLTVSDNAGADLGTFNSWSLAIKEAGCPGPPNLCPWDLDGNLDVGVNDLLILLAAWGPNPGHPADFDGNNDVGVNDLLILLANWGPCPP